MPNLLYWFQNALAKVASIASEYIFSWKHPFRKHFDQITSYMGSAPHTDASSCGLTYIFGCAKHKLLHNTALLLTAGLPLWVLLEWVQMASKCSAAATTMPLSQPEISIKIRLAPGSPVIFCSHSQKFMEISPIEHRKPGIPTKIINFSKWFSSV